MKLTRLAPLAAATTLLLIPAGLGAQVKASERSTVAQVVNGTRIEVDYSRPQVRGRDPVFGGIVHWGETWTPGANFSTTLSVDRPVRLDGHALEAGIYSLWMVPQQDEWRVIVSSDPRLFHTNRPDSSTWLADYALAPAEGPLVEVLTFDFPVVKPDHAVLRLRWGTAAVPMRIDVPGWEPFALEAEDIPTYLGTYAMTDGRGSFRIGLWEEEGAIRGVWYRGDPEAEVVEPSQVRGFQFRAVPLGLHRFLIGQFTDGELRNTEDGFLLFTLDGSGRATGLQWRATGPDGEEFTEASGELIR